MLHSKNNQSIDKYNQLVMESLSYDVPTDTIIMDVIESYFSNVVDVEQLTPRENTYMTLVRESLIDILSDKLDYRNNAFHTNLKKINTFIESSTSKFTLLQPILDVVDIMTNYDLMESKQSNNHKEVGLNEDINLRMISIRESDMFDFVMELFMNGLIPDVRMDQYNLMLKEAVKSTSRDLMESAKDMSTLDNKDNLGISPYIADDTELLFPYEDALNSRVSTISDEYIRHVIIYSEFLSYDDIQVFIDSFENTIGTLEDGLLIKQLGTSLITVLRYIWDNRFYDGELLNRIGLIKEIEKMYITHPCGILRYMISVIVCILWMESYSFDSDSEEALIITKTIDSLVRDLEDMVAYEDTALDGDYSGLIQQLIVNTNVSRNQESGLFKLSMDFPPYDNKSAKTLTSNDTTSAMESMKMSLERKPSELIELLCESFEIQKDGTIKVVVSKKASYMDEYAENHRLLLANRRLKDYEGMKYNLVYHMILIDAIEKNVLYNKNVDKESELYKDAVKARSFAQNDITTYLPEVKRNLKNFDLNRFYHKVKADKATIEINGPDTITGVKKIIKSILL